MKDRLQEMALRAVFDSALPEIDVPADIGKGSDFMRWYEDATGSVKTPSGLHAHDPYDRFSDESVRELIRNTANARLQEYMNVLKLLAEPAQELGAAIEEGDPQAIADRWLSIKPKIEACLGKRVLPSPETTGETAGEIEETVEAVLRAHDIEPDQPWDEIAVEISAEHPNLAEWLSAVGERWDAVKFKPHP